VELLEEPILIQNEDDAIDVLKSYYDGEVADDKVVDFEFDGWPSLEVRLTGDNYKGTITPTVMVGFIELQKEVYRTFAYAKYGTFNTNKLTHKERDELELRVYVKDGSSILNVDFQALLESFMTNSLSKLTGKQVVFTVLSIGLMFAGTSAYKSFLDDRKNQRSHELELRKEDNNAKEKKALVDGMTFMSKEESKRLELMNKIINSTAHSSNVKAHAESAQISLVKSFKKADTIEIAGITLDTEEVKELIKNAKKEFNQVRLDGTYRILTVDSSVPDIFKVKIINTINERRFTALVRDETLQSEYKTIIKNAEWSKKRVDLAITAKEFNDEIKEAVIIKAIEYVSK
jgi:hypothetical protein|tara:strand:+ start:3925 stop:4962 length:1038 start_codon:yes stop_codon:yes gene_type:complete